MYLNPKSIRLTEAMCLDLGKGSNSFQLCNRLMHNVYFNMSVGDDSFKHRDYHLQHLRNAAELQFYLGAAVSDVNRFDLDNHQPHQGYPHFGEFFYEEPMSDNASIPKESVEYKIMKLDDSMQVAFELLHKSFMLYSLFNYEEPVKEWEELAKNNNVNIDTILKPILVLLKPYENMLKKCKKNSKKSALLKKEVSDFLDNTEYKLTQCYNKGCDSQNSIMNRSRCKSRHHINAMRIIKIEDQVEIMTDEFLNEFSCLELKVKRFIEELTEFNQKIMTKIKKEPLSIKEDNDKFLEFFYKAFNQLKDTMKIPKTKASMFIEKTKTFDPKTVSKDIDNWIIENEDSLLLVDDDVYLDNIQYKKFMIFNDESIAVLKSDAEHYEYFMDIRNIKVLVRTYLIKHLREKLKKHPTIAKTMIKSFEASIDRINKESPTGLYSKDLQYNRILLCIKTYFENENILKSLEFSLIKAIEKEKSFEHLDDKMHKLIREHKIKKYAESIVSSKYKHLYNAQSYKLFKELYDLKIETKVIQEMIGKKLAAVDSESTFNANVKKLINHFNNFNMNAYKIKASSNNAKIVVETDDLLILEINNFEQSKILGSPSWCISRNKEYFDQYTEGGAKQYFVYNFKESSKNTKSIIGITLTHTFDIKAAHTKSDARLQDKKLLTNLTELIKDKNIVA